MRLNLNFKKLRTIMLVMEISIIFFSEVLSRVNGVCSGLNVLLSKIRIFY